MEIYIAQRSCAHAKCGLLGGDWGSAVGQRCSWDRGIAVLLEETLKRVSIAHFK